MSHGPHIGNAALLRARLLGPASLTVGERDLAHDAWEPRGGRALLLLLLITPGHRVVRDRVFDALWPELPVEAARNAYYKALHSLRRTLEPDLPPRHAGRFISVSGEVVALTPGSAEIDVDLFEHLIAEAGTSPGNQELLRAALARYRGELLADEPAADWAEARRASLRHCWQDATLRLAALELEAGGVSEAIARAQLVIASDRTNEAAHRLLIAAFARNGQRDQARRQYEQCVDALRDDLGVDPSEETRRAAARLLGPRPSEREVARGRRLRSVVPAALTPLIGREEELAFIQSFFADEGGRLLTLTGSGGVGKTRLALEATSQLAEELTDGAAFVSLAPVRDAELVPNVIAQSLGVRNERGGAITEHVIAALRDRALLLVLDNFEHVRDAAPVVTEILASCPDVCILATSREPLHLRPERLVVVPPFEIPDFREASISALARLRKSPAVALFVERAAAVSPGFTLDACNAEAIVRICQRLDGLPLAIELAAARTRDHEPEQLLTLLEDRLGTLVGGYRDLPPRQQALRETIRWSYDLLPDRERALFRRLAVFAGGCTLEVAGGVAGLDRSEAVAIVQSLVDKSLMRWSRDGGNRATMLETTRAFGLDCLSAAGELTLARDELAAFALDLTGEAVDHLAGPEQARWLDLLDADQDNLREALAWAIEREDAERALRLAGNLWRYWWCRGHLGEGRHWLQRALDLPVSGEPALRGYALNGAASLAESQGDFARADELHRESLVLWRSMGDRVGEARALSGLGTVAAHRGDYAGAREYHEQALQLSRAAGDAAGAARTLDRLGTVARHQGDLARSEAAYRESLALFRQRGDLVNASIVLSNLGEVLYQHGQAEQAAQHFEEALRLERELDLPDGIAYDLANLARVRLDLGEIDRGAALSAQAVRIFRDMGNQLGLAGALAAGGLVAQAGGDLEQARRLVREALQLLDEIDEQPAMPELLEGLASILMDGGEHERAVRLLGAASALRERLAAPAAPRDREIVDRLLATARRRLGAEMAAHALADGRVLTLRDALEEAIHGA